jgi:hypothetical protein
MPFPAETRIMHGMDRSRLVEDSAARSRLRYRLVNLRAVIGNSGRVLAGLLTIVLMGVSACGGGAVSPGASGTNPGAAPSVLPSALPAPSPSPLAKQRTEAGAAEFVRYWFKTLDYATQTGDISRLTAASSQSCAPCEQAVGVVRENYSDGGYLQGGTYTVRSATAEEFAPADRPMIVVSFDRSSRSGFGPDGQVRDSLPAATFVNCQVTVVWENGGWKVATIVGDPLPT